MAQQTFTGRKRVRKFFGHIKEVAEMPNLIEVQKASYDQFLMVDEPAGGRLDEGLQAVFRSVFPISDFSGTSMLEFVRYEFEQPKYDVDECRQRGMTFAAPLKVTLRLIVFDIDEETGAKSVKDIKEQDVYMGDIPLMTMNGTFVVNGTERVIVSQMHRSPGVFFDHDKGKTHSSGKLLFAARVIPYRGSWLDIEFDAKDIVFARIDRRRKLPVTSLMYALGLDGEQILSTFYKKITYKRTKEGWRVPFDANRFRGYSTVNDLIDADTGKVVLEAGKKLTVRQARQLQEKGLKALRMSDEELVGNYLAEDLVNPKTGEIYAEAGEEITEKSMKVLNEQGYKDLPLLDIDHGTYPFVTSSSATAGGACTGSGIPPTRVSRVIAILKAYTTRVGEGPFPTELFDDDGEFLRKTGHEYGTTTGRPRRCGWVDTVIGRYATRINGVTDFVLTKLDVMTGLETVPVCVAYDVEGVRHDEMPMSQSDFHHATPIYEELPGWFEDISHCRTWDELPENCRKYVEFVEERIGARISVIGVGPGREEVIVRHDLLAD